MMSILDFRHIMYTEEKSIIFNKKKLYLFISDGSWVILYILLSITLHQIFSGLNILLIHDYNLKV